MSGVFDSKIEDYEDIINTKWPPESLSETGGQKRPKMSPSKRAKIFLPFAALTGYEDELESVRTRSAEEWDV